MKTPGVMAAASLTLVLLAGAKMGGSSGVLIGRVTKGPLSTVERSGEPPSLAAVAGGRINIISTEGSRLTTVVTASNGTFRVTLGAGTYHLTMPLRPPMFSKDLPLTVTIAPGEVKRVDIHLDTAIR
jgi:hypothetical protein